ncbi:hypothetical protein BN946_scf184851.g59 [Trametes cinnabarina]|uniref:Uncharacterized protein n=1 Tax=Pycnoporus cinnabarinus TaxID=5643 RepID=A0A060S626_PYCCI|nr:hypothetical protein BN946_scf184851.g59 [Trametes cinnabarina]
MEEAKEETKGNPGCALIKGAQVFYLYDAPVDTRDLKNELKVLETFVAKWNANVADTHEKPLHPEDTEAEPPVEYLLITWESTFLSRLDSMHLMPRESCSAKNHHSTHEKGQQERKHISAYVINENGWKRDPHEYGAVVHIYSVDDDPANGYESYHMYSKRRQKLGADGIRRALAAAQMKNFGTLGEGILE